MEIRHDRLLDLAGTTAWLMAAGGDPTARRLPHGLLRASRTPDGPATLHIERVADDRLRAAAWGPGADWALAHARDLVGLGDRAAELPAASRAVRELARRTRGLRLPRTHRVVELLTLVVLQQKVTGKEASRAYRNLVLGFSEPAPGPFDDLWLPLSPAQLRGLPPGAFAPLGVAARAGATLQRLGWSAARLEETARMTPLDAERRLRAVPGIGPWTARSALLRGMRAPDAVPLGDYHLPSTVAYTLAGEERADDARMLELLEPYRGQRGRLIQWIHSAGRMAPRRRGPRRPLRSIPGRRAYESLRRP